LALRCLEAKFYGLGVGTLVLGPMALSLPFASKDQVLALRCIEAKFCCISLGIHGIGLRTYGLGLAVGLDGPGHCCQRSSVTSNHSVCSKLLLKLHLRVTVF